MHHKQSSKADKRRGAHHQRTRANTEHSKSRHTYTSGHHHQRSTRPHTLTPYFKNILVFRPFRSPKIPRLDKINQEKIHFCHFLPWFDACLTLWVPESPEIAWGKGEPVWYRESIQKEPPPPICGATSAPYPHNFSHRKYRKKFAQEDIVFRTKNTAKSQPTFGWKNFRKFFTGECFG